MHSAGIALLALLFAGELLACSRWHMPEAVAAADADVIAVAVVVRTSALSLPSFEADLAIERVLKGKLSENSITVTRSYFCGEERVETGQRIVAYLRRSGGGYVLMLDGTRLHSDSVERFTRDLVKGLPSWSAPRNGIAFMAVPEKFEIAAERELQVFLLYRNTGTTPRTLQYRDWPFEDATRWSAEVTHDGNRIAAKAHPHITREDAIDYFSKNPHPFEIALKPAETFTLPIGPLNRADPGMGHRERFGFKYTPMVRPGKYVISIRGRGMSGEEEQSEPFVVEVR